MRLELTTLLFEIVNFLVLMLVLRKLLYQPLRRAIEARTAAIAEERARAVQVREDAEKLRAQAQDERDELSALQDETRRRALEEAIQERARILAQAREEALGERAQVQRLLESERRSAEEWVRSTAIERSTELAGRMLLDLAPAAVEGALRERLVAELARELAQSGVAGEAEVEVVGSELPSETDLEPVRAVLRRALGGEPRLTVRSDPTLLAGLVVRVGDRIYDASIAGQLDALRGVARELLDHEAAP